MTSTSRQSIQTLATDLSEVLAWGETAEAANAALRDLADARLTEINNVAAERDAAVAQCGVLEQTIGDRDTVIANMNQWLEARNNRILEQDDEIERLQAELALYRPAFILGDATRKQFLGAPFTTQMPGCYESEFYRSGDDRPNITVDYDYVLNTTMPNWRARYPDAKFWWGDIEWFNASASDGGRDITAYEVAKVLPAYRAARDFADAEGKGLLVGAYMLPKRFGTHQTDAEVRAQAEVYRPILDTLSLCVLTLYAIYEDLDKSRTYISRNIAMGRELMPGKKLIVLGAPYWHANVGAPLANTPVSAEWQRMFLEEVTALADGYAPWLPAAYPQPTDEPWWVESVAFLTRTN